MSDTLNPVNSIWPNGMKVDSQGYAVYYPLGTNKVNVPTSSSEWPKGNILISPFVYQDDKLVGFVDTKALITDSQTTIYLPYEHIDAKFSSIDKGQLQIHAPNATVKKASWKNSGKEDIPEAQFKYKGCTTVYDINMIDPNYKISDIVDGIWSEPLWDLEQGYEPLPSGGDEGDLPRKGMFYDCTNLERFISDLPSLKDGNSMFYGCFNLSFYGSLASLTNGSHMFSHCGGLSFYGDLASLTNGSHMFYGCSNHSFYTDLPNLVDGTYMFYDNDLASFSSDLSSLTDGSFMFLGCDNLTSFTSDLSNLTNGHYMFKGNWRLTTFISNLPSLTDGGDMFYGTRLTSFTIDLPSLTNGTCMFQECRTLTLFSSDLHSLTNGTNMFYGTRLTSFTSDLPSLTNGDHMFNHCTNLTSFTSDLSSLTNGSFMFYDCSLDTKSVEIIADTINDVRALVQNATNTKRLSIGIGNTTPNDREIAAFNRIAAKGWTVLVNGSEYTPTSSAAIATLDESGEETVASIPFWAKPIQSDEEHAEYVDSEGNFCNIIGGQFIYGDDISTYGMFASEDDAAANMRLTKIVK